MLTTLCECPELHKHEKDHALIAEVSKSKTNNLDMMSTHILKIQFIY